MSISLTSSRLEAFSDGVIAVIITIMVLDLKVPAHNVANLEALNQIVPLLLVYLLSFIQVGVYWVNHHYLLDDVEHVTHAMLWANLIFLFCLSLFPFATRWVAERGISSFSISLYATAAMLPASCWVVLSRVICHRTGERTGSPTKSMVSTLLNIGAIALAFVSPYIGLAMLVTVAILWLIPPAKVVAATRQSSAYPDSR